MANKSKAKGTAAESKVVKLLRSNGIDAERRALSGNKDLGDVIVRLKSRQIILEVKAGKQTANYSRKLKEEWLRQTRAESCNSGLEGYLVIPRYSKLFSDAEVWDAEGRSFWYIDDFVKYLAEES